MVTLVINWQNIQQILRKQTNMRLRTSCHVYIKPPYSVKMLHINLPRVAIWLSLEKNMAFEIRDCSFFMDIVFANF
jgi:hypothetical protein